MAAGRDTTPQSALVDTLLVEDYESTVLPPHASLPTPPPRSSRTRRRKGARGTTPAASDQRMPSTALSAPQKDAVGPNTQLPSSPPPPIGTAQALGNKINHVLFSVATTVGDVCKGVLGISGFILTIFRVPMYRLHTERTCVDVAVPQPHIIDREAILTRGNANTHSPPPATHYAELVELQSRLENVVKLAGDGTLSWAVRSSEVAMRDLTMEVRLSDLVSKDTFVDKLVSFSYEAKDTARLLQRLSSRVGGAVDTIIATDNHALKILEEIQRDEKQTDSVLHDLVTRAVHYVSSGNKKKRKKLAWTFERTSESTAAQLERLVTEAEVALTSLNRLDAMQDTLHELILLEKKGVDRGREELMAQLWTILGRNRNEVALFKHHHNLLAQMSNYRAVARDKVKATMEQLIKLSEDLSDLRDRAAFPALIGADSTIPLEVHLESLRLGVKRLGVFKQTGIDRENLHLQMLLADAAPDGRRIDSA